MKINNICISGVGGIKELELNFNEKFNVICGANGIGKTTVLNIIADAFCGNGNLVKRNSNYQEGYYSIKYNNFEGNDAVRNLIVREYNPNMLEHNDRYSSEDTKFILYFTINRMINYQNLQAIPKDPTRANYEAGELFVSGIRADDLKGWFENRFLFYNQNNSMTVEQKDNFDVAKKVFGILDETVCFKAVDSGTLDIVLQTNRGDIFFEYLSAGYKTCVFIILGIIKELEFRFKSPFVKAKDFDGVVLIDEIDLHLHPNWQSKLIEALKRIFPQIQFIVTTHSPSVLQSLEVDEIIPLTMWEDGSIHLKNLNLGKYGLKGWSIEEILKDVMEMPLTTSIFFENVKNDFDKAMDKDDVEGIWQNYRILTEMLHPDSILKKILEIQMAGVDNNDSHCTY